MKKKVLSYLLPWLFSFALAFGYFAIIGSKYSSTAVVYPTSTLNSQFLMEAGLRFGDEKELNELIEVLNSNDVAMKVLNEIHQEKMSKFSDLEISNLLKDLKLNTNIERGINRSVSITVTDEDAQQAAFIANNYTIAAYEHFCELVNKSINQHLVATAQLYDEKLLEVNVLRDTLEKLEALGESKVVGMVLVKSPRYRVFDNQFENEMVKLASLKGYKEHLEGIIKKNLPQLFVVSKAIPATEIPQKSNLVKSVLFSIMSVLLLAAIRNRKRFFSA